MKKYHKFDENGRPIASYARNQPNIEGLVYIEEAENNFKKWDGSNWIDDIDKYLIAKIEDARNISTTRWIDSSKAVTAIQANYNVFKNGSYSTITEVETAYNNFINFMEL